MTQTLIPALRAAGVECYTRSEWRSPREADGSYRRRETTHPMPKGPALYHFLHITVTDDTDLPVDGKAGARKVESFGLSTPPMVSYQDLVTNEGRYFEGQSYGVKGTHTINDKDVPGFPHDLNLFGYATAIMQNVDDEVTDRQVDVVAMIFAARELAGLVKRGASIYPHRKFDWKSCPGDKAVARLPEIIRLRNKYVRDGLPNMEDDMASTEAKAQLDRIEGKLDKMKAGSFKRDRVLVALVRTTAGAATASDQEILMKLDEILADDA